MADRQVRSGQIPRSSRSAILVTRRARVRAMTEASTRGEPRKGTSPR